MTSLLSACFRLSLLPAAALAAGLHAAEFTLPALPPIPDTPAPAAEASVPLGDPAAEPELKLDFPIADGPFQPTWESIAQNHPGVPNWLRIAKFGIWVHFGPQSSGQSGDWYAKRLYLQEGRFKAAYEKHLREQGHPTEAGYKDLLRAWNPIGLKPSEQVALFRDAGARFLFIQGVHHDNFDNWNSRYQPWNSMRLGPRRDLLSEWTSAARAAGLRYGVAFHHEYSWWWYQTAFGSDKTGPRAGEPYDGRLSLADGKGTWWEGLDPRLLYTVNLREYQGLDVDFAPVGGLFTRHRDYARWYATWWALRIMDVIENYDPDFIYTDGNSTQPFSGLKSGTGLRADAMQRVAAHFFNRSLERRKKLDTFCIVKFLPPTRGVAATKEGSIPRTIKDDQPWIGETAIGDWFYAPGIVSDAGAVVHYLLENAARDGATAVCVAQNPDGSLDEDSRRMLREVGDWMRVNGSAIYGSRAWKQLGEGDTPEGKLRVLPGGNLGRRQADFVFTPADFRFTVSLDGALHAWCLTVPAAGSELRIRSLGRKAGLLTEPVRFVRLLGCTEKLEWRQDDDALVVRCPAGLSARFALGFRVE